MYVSGADPDMCKNVTDPQPCFKKLYGTFLIFLAVKRCFEKYICTYFLNFSQLLKLLCVHHYRRLLPCLVSKISADSVIPYVVPVTKTDVFEGGERNWDFLPNKLQPYTK